MRARVIIRVRVNLRFMVFLHWMELGHRTSKSTSIVTHFLQEHHTYSDKATPPTSVTSHWPSIFKPPQPMLMLELVLMNDHGVTV